MSAGAIPRPTSSRGLGYLWIVPLTLSLWLFLPSEQFHVGADGWRYMARAIGLVEGHGYVNIDRAPLLYRGPIYPLWLAGFFRLFGYEVGVGYLATRTFSVFGAMAAYALGARWFSPRAGVLTSLLVLTSSSLAAWSDQVHIDYPLAVMLLSSILALAWALDGDGRMRYLVAGGVLGVAYLLKETAILLVPLPFLAVLTCPRYRTWRGLVGALSFLGAFLLLVGPWWFYVWREKGVLALLGGGAGVPSSSWFLRSASAGRLEVARSLVAYYRHNLAASFGLAPLLVVGWVGTTMLALRGRTWARMLLACALCLMPLLVLQGSLGYREQQSMIFHLLSYFALVGWVRVLVPPAPDRSGRSAVEPIVAVGLGVALLLLQIGSEDGRWLRYVSAHQPLKYVSRSWEDLTPGRADRQIAEWLSENVPEDSPILASMSPVGAVVFYSEGRYPVFPMPQPVRFRVPSRPAPEPQWSGDCGRRAGQPQHSLFLWLEGGRQWETGGTVYVAALTEETILATLRGRGARYLILTRNDLFTAAYYRASHQFRVVPGVGGPRLLLVEALRPAPSRFDLRVERRVPGFLRHLRDARPYEAGRLEECFLGRELGLGRAKIEAVVSGQQPSFNGSGRERLIAGSVGEDGEEEDEE